MPGNGDTRPQGWLRKNHPLVKQLGQGGMGSIEVRKDECESNGLVAVKTTRTNVPQAILAREYLIMTDVLEPRFDIARAIDYFREGSNNYMVLQYYAGGSLHDLITLYYLNGEKRIAQAFLWHAMASLADAVAYIHKAGVVHRDIKPSNVFLHWHDDVPRDEDYPELVLGDFGVAADMNAPDYRKRSQNGTPMWQPPESPQAGPETDVWAIGAVIHALAHGGLPPLRSLPANFRRDPRARGYWWEQPQSKAITPLAIKYSPELEEFVYQTLRFDPDNRISSRDLSRKLRKITPRLVDRNFRPLREFARHDIDLGTSARQNFPRERQETAACNPQ